MLFPTHIISVGWYLREGSKNGTSYNALTRRAVLSRSRETTTVVATVTQHAFHKHTHIYKTRLAMTPQSPCHTSGSSPGPLTPDVRGPSKATPFEIPSGQSGTRSGLSPNSISPPMFRIHISSIYHQQLHNLCKWQSPWTKYHSRCLTDFTPTFWMRSGLFWDISQRIVVITYRLFGAIKSVLSSKVNKWILDSWRKDQ